MNNYLELLGTDLFKTNFFKEFKYWKRTLAAEVGWHYPLDIVWILRNMEKLNLPKGATILDAGGGYGLMQFILSAKGYNVINVDFSERTLPFPYKPIFKFKQIIGTSCQNEYSEHLKKVKTVASFRISMIIGLSRIKHWNLFSYIKEAIVRHKKGVITFYQADFSYLKEIKSNSIDAIVSVSAIEHNPSFETIGKSVKEFKRVLKKKGCIFITTSATDKKTWFHKPSQGWCFNRKTLENIFCAQGKSETFKNYKDVFCNINNSDYLKNNLPKYYYYKKNCGLPYGKWKIKYIPVGIVLTK